MTPLQIETVAEKVLNYFADPDNVLNDVSPSRGQRITGYYSNPLRTPMKVTLIKGPFTSWSMDIQGLSIDAFCISGRISAMLARRVARQLSPVEANVIAAFCGDSSA